MVGKTISGLLAGAVAFAGTLVPSAAYEVGDVCSVEIGVLYTMGGGPHHGKPQKFTITSQEPSGFLQIAPGTFTLTVDGKLCSGHPDYPGVIDAFKGITSYTLSENEISSAASKIDVICLDQELAGSSDQSIDMAPIIISIAIDHNVLQIGETATVTVGAIDPNDNESPGDYAFNMDNGGTVTNSAGSCASGVCSSQFTASSTESGNQGFSFQVRDADFDTNNLEDTVFGNIIVDDSGAVQFGVENYHRPSAFTVSIDNEHLTYGQEATITITATDSDLTASLQAPDTLDLRDPGFVMNHMSTPGDPLTWTYPSNSGGTAFASYILKQVYGNVDITSDPPTTAHELACNIGDISQVGVPSVAGNTKTWVLKWNPWNSATGSQSSYGMVSCAFDFQAFDSYNLLSDSVQVSLTATATNQDPSFTEIPFFESIMIDDISPAVGGEVEIRMFYSDPSATPNAVNFGLSLPSGSGMIEDITRCDIDPATDMETNCDSPVTWVDGTDFTFSDSSGCLPSGSDATYESGCSHILKITIGASAQTGLGQAENKVRVTITDADSDYADFRDLDYWNIVSSRRAKRSEISGQSHDGFALSFSISPNADGTAALVANMAAAGDMSIETVPEDETEAETNIGTIVGAVVGSVAAVAAIGALVVRRRNREAAGANIDLGSTWESDGGATTIV